MPTCTGQDKTVYHPRNPKASPLWQCVDAHFENFVHAYEARYEKSYGFLRPVIESVVHKFADCGDLHKGFAVAKCDQCQEKFIVAYSCKGRCSCPSCHQKKVLLFGEFLAESVVYPVRAEPSRLG